MSKLKVFIPKESDRNESRVAVSIDTVKAFLKDEIIVTVETEAGAKSRISDKDFDEAGALISKDQKKTLGYADVIMSVNAPTKTQVKCLKEGSIWVSFMALPDKEILGEFENNKSKFFSMNFIPRITRAQKLDALSSQSNIGGYKAVILGADYLPKIIPMMMTAAGTLKPAYVVVLGAGVAGLQAIATAKRLGAIVEASDVRSNVKEQVESLGGRFIDIPGEVQQDKNGYAQDVTPEYLKKQNEEVGKRLKIADLVITTALIPGKKAPKLITSDMVKSMKKGSVIVDMATSQGGNCAVSVKDKVVEKFGVTVIGHSNLPGLVAKHSSEMYAKNVYNFVSGMVKEGKLAIDLNDEIYKDSLLTKEVSK